MKFSLSIVTLLLGTFVAAEGLSKRSIFGNGQKVLDDKPAVPGDNPLKYCAETHAADLLVLEYVHLDPNPPTAGNVLTIKAKGLLKEDVGEGAYVQLQVKYGLIRIVTTKADLCEQVSNVDLECPIKKGVTTITKEVELPKEIPPGKYTVFADAYTKEGKKIVCMEATVVF